MGKSYYLGESKEKCVKLDLFYSENFIRPVQNINDIRMASMDDIVAIKIDVIAREGRKKDFWDIHELLGCYPLEEMLELHHEMFPHTHERDEILKNMVNFESANHDFNPVCLKGKRWELIMLDILDTVNKIKEV